MKEKDNTKEQIFKENFEKSKKEIRNNLKLGYTLRQIDENAQDFNKF